MNYLKTFEVYSEPLDEGAFDKLANLYDKYLTSYKDETKLLKSLQAKVTEDGTKATKFLPKPLKVGDTVTFLMGDLKNPLGDYGMTLSKIADLPDGSTLFQIVGTTSEAMRKALVNSTLNEDFTKKTVMAIVPAAGYVKGKPATMKLLKNIFPDGKDYVTGSMFQGFSSQTNVETLLQKSK